MTVHAEFDEYCASYQEQHARSIRLSGENVDFFAEYKAQDARRLSERARCEVRTILDFGSGIGSAVKPLLASFPEAQLTCLDVSSMSLAVSRQINGAGPTYQHYDGRALPFADASFDLVFTACVFHHIPEAEHVGLLAELRRVLQPQGLFVLFEHNPWNPLTRHVVASCPFDEHAVLISAPEMKRRLRAAGFERIETRYRIFFPHALKALRPLEPLLAPVPLGGQYVLSTA